MINSGKELLDKFTATLSSIGLLDGKEGLGRFLDDERREEFKLWYKLRDYYETDDD